jgi:uncharacterized membrane protein YvbJ
MKCPRCETENDRRTICKKCGMFLSDGRTRNRVVLTPEELRKEDLKKLRRILFGILKVVWMAVVFLIISILVVAIVMTFSAE